jgi:flagellar basal-body rod protein FlgB
MPDSSIKTLETMLDVSAYRQRILTSNIANADTPGYRAKDIDFQGELDRALAAGGKVGSITIHEPMTTLPNRDGNTVNIDVEMAKIAENSLTYNAATQLLTMKLRMLKSIINGGP